MWMERMHIIRRICHNEEIVMSRYIIKIVVLIIMGGLVLALQPPVYAQNNDDVPGKNASAPPDEGWPQVVQSGELPLTIYQPGVEHGRRIY